MGIVRFEKDGKPALGVRFGDMVLDLSVAAPQLPADVADLLRAGPAALDAAFTAAQDAKPRVPLAELKLLAPTVNAGKIVCLGMNFKEHAAEGGAALPTYPLMFLRSNSSLVGSGQPILRPRVSDKLDYECELVVFVGRKARHVKAADGLDYVAGYAAFNDASIRDYQIRTPQWTIGKIFDGTGAIGPEFVPAHRLPPGCKGLRMQTRLNGEVVQSTSLSDMIFDVAHTIELLTECMTLEPGDLIVMGTPAGVGALRTPPLYMKPGDVCEVEIEQIGVLRNPIVQGD